MPITEFLYGSPFDPEGRRVISVAYELSRAALHCGNRDSIADKIVADKIIELAKAGERNPDRLCELALNDFQQHV